MRITGYFVKKSSRTKSSENDCNQGHLEACFPRFYLQNPPLDTYILEMYSTTVETQTHRSRTSLIPVHHKSHHRHHQQRRRCLISATKKTPICVWSLSRWPHVTQVNEGKRKARQDIKRTIPGLNASFHSLCHIPNTEAAIGRISLFPSPY